MGELDQDEHMEDEDELDASMIIGMIITMRMKKVSIVGNGNKGNTFFSLTKCKVKV